MHAHLYIHILAAIQTVEVTMSIAMYIIREIEHANLQCHNCPVDGCHELIRDVDGAYALYSGSLEGPDGTGEGKLLYALADKECKYFKTCGKMNDATQGVANVNIRIAELFQVLQKNITDRACAPARAHKDDISRLIYLPIVQGTLRYAYMRSRKGVDATDEEVATGAMLASSVAPIIAACSYHDASIIMKNMELSQIPNFEEVRGTFMNHFDCLGLTCKDLGGLIDQDSGKYYDDFQPCHFDEPVDDDNSSNKSSLWGVVSGAIVASILVIGCMAYRFRSRQKKKRSSTDDDDLSGSSDDSDFILS